jgi:hypothetical protein
MDRHTAADLLDNLVGMVDDTNGNNYDDALKMGIKALRAEQHGKWIHDGYDFPHGVDWMHCSECGKRDVYCPATRTNFCPNCGARMDGE